MPRQRGRSIPPPSAAMSASPDATPTTSSTGAARRAREAHPRGQLPARQRASARRPAGGRPSRCWSPMPAGRPARARCASNSRRTSRKTLVQSLGAGTGASSDTRACRRRWAGIRTTAGSAEGWGWPSGSCSGRQRPRLCGWSVRSAAQSRNEERKGGLGVPAAAGPATAQHRQRGAGRPAPTVDRLALLAAGRHHPVRTLCAAGGRNRQASPSSRRP